MFTLVIDCGLQSEAITDMSNTSQEKKRKVVHTMFEKWRRDFDCEFKTVLWLECESPVEGRTKAQVYSSMRVLIISNR